MRLARPLLARPVMTGQRQSHVVCGLVSALLLAAPSLAPAEGWNDVKEPDKATALADWTPAQQYKHGREIFQGPQTAIVIADLFGDKLSELGRAHLVVECLKGAKEDASSAVIWAVCGPDAKALDLAKAAAGRCADGTACVAAGRRGRHVCDACPER